MGDGGVIALPAMININFRAILPSRQIIALTIIDAIFFFPFVRRTSNRIVAKKAFSRFSRAHATLLNEETNLLKESSRRIKVEILFLENVLLLFIVFRCNEM